LLLLDAMPDSRPAHTGVLSRQRVQALALMAATI
jgi:hypothetical protein